MSGIFIYLFLRYFGVVRKGVSTDHDPWTGSPRSVLGVRGPGVSVFRLLHWLRGFSVGQEFCQLKSCLHSVQLRKGNYDRNENKAQHFRKQEIHTKKVSYFVAIKELKDTIFQPVLIYFRRFDVSFTVHNYIIAFPARSTEFLMNWW